MSEDSEGCGCSDERHSEAERRVELELAPRYRALCPRLEGEDPHAYIARFWSDPALGPAFASDLEEALGFK